MAYDPFVTTNPVVGAMEAHRGRVEQIRENSARHAWALATLVTTGDGQFLIRDAAYFNTAFIERPAVGYGYSLDSDEVLSGVLPRCTGGVRGWIKDSRGHYIGAYLFLSVQTDMNADGDPAEAATGTAQSFRDDFNRPDSTLVGKGWQQTGGDFYVNSGRCVVRDASAFMGQGFGRIPLVLESDLRSPNSAHPCIYAWGSSVAGGAAGYQLAFDPTATGTNLTLRRNNVQVAAKHIGPAGTAIGNSNRRLRLQLMEDGSNVNVTASVDGNPQLLFQDPLTSAPSGGWSGVGNAGPAGDVSIDNVSITAIIDGAAQPPAEAEVPPDGAFVITHDFTFTGLAYKKLPEYLLEPGAVTP